MSKVKEVKVAEVNTNEYICTKLAEPKTVKAMGEQFGGKANNKVNELSIVARIHFDQEEDAYLTSFALGGANGNLFNLDVDTIDYVPCLADEVMLIVEALKDKYYFREKEYHNVENTSVKHSPEQMKEIKEGMEAGINIFEYADVTNSPEKMREIKERLIREKGTNAN